MFVEIAPGIKSWKNYLDEKTLAYYLEFLEGFSEESWYFHGNIETGDIAGDYLDGKLSVDMIHRKLHEKIITQVATEHLWIYCHGNVLRLKVGESSSIEDSSTKVLIDYKPFIQGKLALYMSDFEGGEIVFPEIEFEYKPEAGELLIFDIDQKLDHYTKPVTSGVRYVYMDYVIKHPGYYMP